jgi:hypothetical protein
MEKYRPSNGSEGDFFYEDFCKKCVKDKPLEYRFCPILNATYALEVNSPSYPQEWQIINGKPTCTAFKERDDG